MKAHATVFHVVDNPVIVVCCMPTQFVESLTETITLLVVPALTWQSKNRVTPADREVYVLYTLFSD